MSVIVPTRNRSMEVERLLTSIFRQTCKPQEIIIVDDSTTDDTHELCMKLQTRFNQSGINLAYVYGDNTGICAARNKGTSIAHSDIVLFLDDDVILNKNYIFQILAVYNENSNVKGVTGYLGNYTNSLGKALSNALNRVFQAHIYKEEGKALVLPSGGLTYPYNLTHIIKCQWMSGTNSSYKRSILEKIKWDENLKSYSLYDDVDLSLRVRRAFPDSLYMTPYALCSHHHSNNARRSLKVDAYIRTAYPLYFFYKHVPQTVFNRIRFIYSQIGRSLLLTISYKKIIYIRYLVVAYIHTLSNLQKIRKGNLMPPQE